MENAEFFVLEYNAIKNLQIFILWLKEDPQSKQIDLSLYQFQRLLLHNWLIRHHDTVYLIINGPSITQQRRIRGRR